MNFVFFLMGKASFDSFTLALDSVHPGSLMSLRSFAHIGLSVLTSDFLHLGLLMSSRSFSRFGFFFFVFGLARPELSTFALDLAHTDFLLSLQQPA